MDEVLVNDFIDKRYWVMGRLTLMDNPLTLREFVEQLFATYDHIVASEEVGDATGKRHFHFVIAGDKIKYSSINSFRTAVRKYIRDHFPVQGNKDYMIKESLTPVKSIAYTVKDGVYETEGIQDFFFLIVENNHTLN